MRCIFGGVNGFYRVPERARTMVQWAKYFLDKLDELIFSVSENDFDFPDSPVSLSLVLELHVYATMPSLWSALGIEPRVAHSRQAFY